MDLGVNITGELEGLKKNLDAYKVKINTRAKTNTKTKTKTKRNRTLMHARSRDTEQLI